MWVLFFVLLDSFLSIPIWHFNPFAYSIWQNGCFDDWFLICLLVFIRLEFISSDENRAFEYYFMDHWICIPSHFFISYTKIWLLLWLTSSFVAMLSFVDQIWWKFHQILMRNICDGKCIFVINMNLKFILNESNKRNCWKNLCCVTQAECVEKGNRWKWKQMKRRRRKRMNRQTEWMQMKTMKMHFCTCVHCHW